jgi:hypothetical protein
LFGDRRASLKSVSLRIKFRSIYGTQKQDEASVIVYPYSPRT